MITGVVNGQLEAMILLDLLGTGSRQQVDAVIDTGFTGHLTLSPALIATLQLTWLGRESGVLADASVGLFDVYQATVIWDGQPCNVEVQAIDAEPLVGMALLDGFSLQVDVTNGGAVRIAPLP